QLMELPFSHEALSVFRNYEAFAAINPVVKAPTFVTDDGTVLMDSALILEYLERLPPSGGGLTPKKNPAHAPTHRKNTISPGPTACRHRSKPHPACSSRRSPPQNRGCSKTGRCRPTSRAR